MKRFQTPMCAVDESGPLVPEMTILGSPYDYLYVLWLVDRICSTCYLQNLEESSGVSVVCQVRLCRHLRGRETRSWVVQRCLSRSERLLERNS